MREVKAHDEAVSGMDRITYNPVYGTARAGAHPELGLVYVRESAPEPLRGGGASDGEMGDEQWVRNNIDKHAEVTHNASDGLWQIWNGRGTLAISGEYPTEAEAWADARRRLTPEAAAEPVRVENLRDLEILGLRRRIHMLEGHNQWFERCESAWCNPSVGQFNSPAIEGARAYLADTPNHAAASASPALKAQDGDDNRVEYSSGNVFADLGLPCAVELDQIAQLKAVNQRLASLANKLASALEKVVPEMRREHDIGDGHFSTTEVEECESAIADAKKAGCT